MGLRNGHYSLWTATKCVTEGYLKDQESLEGWKTVIRQGIMWFNEKGYASKVRPKFKFETR